MSNKDVVLELLNLCNRRNMPALISWLENDTDFFTAPASTKYHGSFKGGLLEHSLDVYECLLSLKDNIIYKNKIEWNDESIVICSLLHDVCKTNFYKESKRNKKDQFGNWIEVPYYEIEDTHPYGHGECSVMLIEKFIKLTDEEKYAIRWHMGGYDPSVKSFDGSIRTAFEKYSFAVALHQADMMATYLCESGRKGVF